MKKNASVVAMAAIIISYLSTSSYAQTTDSVRIDYKKIFAYCLDADVASALPLLRTDSTKKISLKDAQLKAEFEKRFGYATDQSDFMQKKQSPIDPLLSIYHRYWRTALLDKDHNYDSMLVANLSAFLKKQYSPSTLSLSDDSIDIYLKKYVESNGLHTTGYAQTGKLIDLLVWKTQKDTVYSFTVGNEKLKPRVLFMDDFVTLGWEEYATLGTAYPGGWANSNGLYCVRSAYDLNSENFLISYLAHEGRHFADAKLFPKLSSSDLEYRAILVELSLANKTLYKIIDFFINNANYNSDNGHSVGNYCAIRDISRKLFGVEFEKDKAKWEAIDQSKINAAAREVLRQNTKMLKRKGKDVSHFIKPE